jgi:hypothetical protein
VLNAVSDFYTDKLAGRDRIGNEASFNYDFSKVTVKAFLDLADGISIDSIDLVTLLELIKFVSLENKKDSEFEGKLLTKLCAELKKAKLSLDSKLLISNTFDNFIGALEETFFETHTDEEIDKCVMNLDMDKELAKMITSEESQKANDEVRSQVFLLAMKLKRNKTTKSTEPTQTQATNQATTQATNQPTVTTATFPIISTNTYFRIGKFKRIVKINFYHRCLFQVFTMDVNTSNTVLQLIDQVNETKIVSHACAF